MNLTVVAPYNSIFPYYDSCIFTSSILTKDFRKCPYFGIDFRILDELLMKLKINFSIHFYDAPGHLQVGGRHADGRWSGILGLIQNGTFDTTAMALVNSETRLAAFDMSYPVRYSHYVFLCSSIRESTISRLISVLQPFSASTWLAIAGSVICLFLTYLYFVTFSSANPKLGAQLWKFLNLIKGEYNLNNFNARYEVSKNIYLIFISIFLLLFVSLYQGFMLIGFAHKTYFDVSYTFQDLILALENGDANVLTDYHWAFTEKVNSATPNSSSPFYKLQQINQTRPFLITKTLDESIRLVQSGKYVYPMLQERMVFFRKNYCGLSAIYITNDVEWSSFVFRKNSTFTRLLNKAISESWPLIEHYQQKYANQLESMESAVECPAESSTLTTDNMFGVFILLIIGMFFGFLVFMTEICRNSFCKVSLFNLPTRVSKILKVNH